MADEEDESLLSVCSEEGVFLGESHIINYIPFQREKENELKRRKLDSFVMELSQNNKQKLVQSDLPWSVKYTPQNSEQLCLHPKKIQDVRKKLHSMINGETDTRILVLSGPTGTGKSITAKIICNDLMTERVNNQKSLSLATIDDRLERIVEFNYLSTSTNSINYFSDFLEECKMLTGGNEKCIIIEELPNIYQKETHLSFQRSLLKWIETSKIVKLPPMVICMTEYDIEGEAKGRDNLLFSIENTFKVETVFGFKLMQYENIYWERINFNPVAKTYLKKALINVIKREGIVINKELNCKINEWSQLGDLRNSINVLEYSVKFFRGLENDEILGRESGINLFHSVGKLIYGTRHEEEEMLSFLKRRNLNSFLMGAISREIGTEGALDKQLVTAQLISDDVSESLTKVNLCCLENYSVLNNEVSEDLLRMVNDWSLVDSMVNYSRTDPNWMGLIGFFSCLSTRLRMHKINKGTGRHASLIFSRESKANKKRRFIKEEIQKFTSRRTHRLCHLNKYSYLSEFEALTIDGFYQSQIMGSFKVRQKQFMKHGRTINLQRLGGNFTGGINAEHDFKPEEDLKTLEKHFYEVDIVKKEELAANEEDEEYDFEDDPLEFSDDEFSDDELEATKKPLPKLYEEDDSFSDDDLGL